MNILNTEGGSGATNFFSKLNLSQPLQESTALLKSGLLTVGWMILFLLFAGTLRAANCDDPILLTVSCDPVLCNGDTNGYVSGKVYGGTPPYTLVLTGPASDTITLNTYGGSYSFDGLPAGNYNVTVWDVNYDYNNHTGCKANGSAILSEPPPLELEVSGDVLYCAADMDGKVKGVVQGGTAPYRVILSGDADATVTLDNSGDNFEFGGLGAGNYIITVRDAYYLNDLGDGCRISANTVIITEDSPEETNLAATICEGDSYPFGDTTLTTTGVYDRLLKNSAGCDSLVILTLTVNEQSEDTKLAATICEGDSYPFGDTTLTTTGVYDQLLKNSAGCDSLVILTLTVNEQSKDTKLAATICEGDSYPFGDTTLTTTGVYDQLLKNSAGCDSLVILTLMVTDTIRVDETAEICEGETYPFGGSDLSETGTYTETIVVDGSCDTIITLMLTVYPERDTINATICEGDSYEFGGELLTVAGEYTDTSTTDIGCDLFTTLILMVTDTIRVDETAEICEGETYPFGGSDLSETGTYTETIVVDGSCDTIITLMLTVYPERDTINATICEGDSYEFGGELLTVAGEYTDTSTTDIGCDLFTTLILMVTDTIRVDETAEICEGETYPFGGSDRSETGTYTETIVVDGACDTIITLMLTVYPERDTINATICEGDSYEFGGELLTVAGEYTDTSTTDIGCDLFTTLILMVTDTIRVDETAEICEGETYPFGGSDLSETGTYTETIVVDGACDTIITLMLTVYPERDTINATICEGDSYEFGGELLTVAGEYTDTSTTAIGCDLFTTLILMVTDTIRVDETAEICEGETYPFGGSDLSETGTYTETIVVDGACDTIITLMLTVYPERDTINATICEGDSYEFGGELLTVAGEYTDTSTTAIGCDLFTTLILMVTDTIRVDETAEICEGETYSFGGSDLSETGTYTETIVVDGACDTIITLMLTVYPERDTINATICGGDSYEFGGELLTVAGEYTDTSTTAIGCDLFTTLILMVTDTIRVDETAEICEGETYPFGGSDLSETGTYTETIVVDGSCDTIITLMLTVYPERDTINATICEGDSYEFGGELLTVAGEYTDTSTTAIGCDLFTTLILMVTDTIRVDETAEICEGETYPFGGSDLSETGTYTETIVVDGACDTIITLMLTVYPERDTINATICEGDSYEFGGELLTVAGEYTDTSTTAIGCDLFTTLILMVTDTIRVDETAEICEGETYPFGGSDLSETGTYTETIVVDGSCDTIITLMLTVYPERDTINATICEGDSYEFGGELLTVAGEYTDTSTTDIGCDLFTTLILMVTDTIRVDETAEICEGETYPFGGSDLSETGTYTETIVVDGSCDTIITLMLTVYPERDTINATICEGDSYEFGGELLTVAGEYTDTSTTAIGCDLFTTLILMVTDTIRVDETAEICEGETYPFGGSDLSETGTYTETIVVDGACDTIITLMLTVYPERDTINATICEGDSYEFGGELLTVAGEYTDTSTTAIGCDLFTTLILMVTDTIRVDETAEICEGETYPFGGSDLSETGTYTETIVVDGSCDTIITLMLTVYPERDTINATICEGDSYEFGGELLTVAGEYTDTSTTAIGCDLFTTLILMVTDTIRVDETAEICEGETYPFGGSDLSETGTYLDTIAVDGACDTIVTLMLTVNPKPDAMIMPMDSVFCELPDTLLLTVMNKDTSQDLTYQWAPDFAILTDPTDVSVTVDLMESAIFSVSVTNQYECSDTLMVSFTEDDSCPDTLTITADRVEDICPGDPVTLTVESDCEDCIYEWSTGGAVVGTGTSVVVNPEVTTTYTVTVITANGCVCDTEASITVVIDCPDCTPESFFIPSAFTPNGDDINDEFCVRTTWEAEPDEVSMIFTIYDRWGEVVFHTESFGDCWDGTYEGAALAQDVYVYKLILVCPGGTTFETFGDVALLR